jgi:hypothetical protein
LKSVRPVHELNYPAELGTLGLVFSRRHGEKPHRGEEGRNRGGISTEREEKTWKEKEEKKRNEREKEEKGKRRGKGRERERGKVNAVLR